MNKLFRCKFRNITDNYICKNRIKNPFIINNKILCKLHYKYYYNDSALTIQRYYKGFKQRKILNNIYKKLPTDIQYIVIDYMREEIYYKNYLKTIGNIVEKKILNTIKYFYDEILNEININDNELMYQIFQKLFLNEDYIVNNFKLYTKYYYVLKNKNMLNKSILIEFQQLLYDNVQLLHLTNYIEFYNLLFKIQYKIEQYLFPLIFISSES